MENNKKRRKNRGVQSLALPATTLLCPFRGPAHERASKRGSALALLASVMTAAANSATRTAGRPSSEPATNQPDERTAGRAAALTEEEEALVCMPGRAEESKYLLLFWVSN